MNTLHRCEFIFVNTYNLCGREQARELDSFRTRKVSQNVASIIAVFFCKS